MTETTTVTEAEPAVIEFSVGCSRTINLGNFESLRVEATVTVEVREDDDVARLRIAAQKELRSLLEDTYKAQYKKANDRPY